MTYIEKIKERISEGMNYPDMIVCTSKGYAGKCKFLNRLISYDIIINNNIVESTGWLTGAKYQTEPLFSKYKNLDIINVQKAIKLYN